jgi:hypothetical protein
MNPLGPQGLGPPVRGGGESGQLGARRNFGTNKQPTISEPEALCQLSREGGC